MLRTPTNASGISSKFSPIPSSPPVHPYGFFCTRTVPACANASVTIAKAIPPTRRLTAPSTRGTAIPTATSRPSVGQSPHSQRVSAIAVT